MSVNSCGNPILITLGLIRKIRSVLTIMTAALILGSAVPAKSYQFECVPGLSELSLSTSALERISRERQEYLSRLNHASDVNSINEIHLPDTFPKALSLDKDDSTVTAVEGQKMIVRDLISGAEKSFELDGYRLDSRDYEKLVVQSGPYLVVLRDGNDSPFVDPYPGPHSDYDKPQIDRQRDQAKKSPREILIADTRKADASGKIPASAVKTFGVREYKPVPSYGNHYPWDFFTLDDGDHVARGGSYISALTSRGPFVLLQTQSTPGSPPSTTTILELGSDGTIKSVELPESTSHGGFSLAYNDDFLYVSTGPDGYDGGERDQIYQIDRHDFGTPTGKPKRLALEGRPWGYNNLLLPLKSSDGKNLLVTVRDGLHAAPLEIMDVAENKTIYRHQLPVSHVTDIVTDGRNIYFSSESQNVAVLNLKTFKEDSIPNTAGVSQMTITSDGYLNLFKIPERDGNWDSSAYQGRKLIRLPIR